MTASGADGVHERARRAWRMAIEEDDARGSIEREQRLILRNAFAPQPRSRVGPVMQLALGAAIGGLVVAAWLGRVREANAPLALVSSAAPAAAAPGPGSPATAVARAAAQATSPTDPPASAETRVVATRVCTGCRKNGAPIAAGEPLDASSPIEVPRGATLLAAWSVAGGLIDPRSGIDVVGPARVRATDSALVLEQGTAVAETRGRGELQSGEGARVVVTIGSDAAWRVDVTPERTRIDVARGEVSVKAPGEAPRSLHAGEHVEILPSAAPAAAPSQTAAASVPPPGAPRSLSPAPDPRAVLDSALAQLLATGNVAPTVVTLNELLHSANEPVAFEAATALVRLVGSDRERAAAWAGYLQRERPTPFGEIAMANLANLLLDLGNPVEASVWVTALSHRPNVPEAAALVERARGRLSMRNADEVLDRDVRKLAPARKR
jgi:hypothetical protein